MATRYGAVRQVGERGRARKRPRSSAEERAVLAAVEACTVSAAQSGCWRLEDEVFALGNHDRDITRALRQLDPAVAPLYVVKVYRTPWNTTEHVWRHLICRLVTNPVVKVKVEEFERRGIRNVRLPSPMPPELRGLTSEGPYLECLLLEGEPGDDGAPGEYRPMTWQLVDHLACAMAALRNHSITDLDRKRIAANRSRREQREREFAEDLRARRAHARRLAQESRGELIRMPSATGAAVSISSALLSLRKIAAAEVSA